MRLLFLEYLCRTSSQSTNHYCDVFSEQVTILKSLASRETYYFSELWALTSIWLCFKMSESTTEPFLREFCDRLELIQVNYFAISYWWLKRYSVRNRNLSQTTWLILVSARIKHQIITLLKSEPTKGEKEIIHWELEELILCR